MTTTDAVKVSEHAFRFAGKDGKSIAAYRWESARRPRYAVQIAHGMAEYARRYARFAHELVAHAAVVYANDHRAHGQTAASLEALGDFENAYDAMPEDAAILTRRIRAEQAGRKVILIGHSMGSFIAQAYVLDHSDLIDGLVLSGSTALDEMRKANANRPAGFAGLNSFFEPARTPFDWLSRDEAEVDAYIADPYCGFAGKNQGERMAAQAARIADPEQLKRIRPDLPIYLFAGDKDPLNGDLAFLHVLIDRYRAAGIKDVSYDFYKDGRHEMLNETNRDEVVRNLLAWIDRVVG
jgi:alpha-beta hydrolase superfamily lysophospholipase